MRLDDGSNYLDTGVWEGCLRDWITKQPKTKRDALIIAFARYRVECDKVEDRIVVNPPPEYLVDSHIAFFAVIERGRLKVFVSLQYHGDEWLFAERVKVVADGFRWTSPRVRFSRDNTSVIWETALLPFKGDVKNVVDKIIASEEAIIRFDGASVYDDVLVTEAMKQDLEIMRAALK